MKIKWFKYAVISLAGWTLSGCTNLDEKTYDILTSDTFYQTKDNVIQGFIRPFEHAYWTVSGATFQIAENSADHFMTPNRQGHWLDSQNYFRVHRHQWTIDDWIPRDAWNHNFQGVIFVNSAIADLSKLTPTKFDMTESEMQNLIAQLRTLRAWFYINLLDMFRNIPIVTDYPSQDLEPKQASPQETFTFIEKELTEALPLLLKKEGNGGNGNKQGQWTQAGAAALLARLYLNAGLWIGTEKLDECSSYCDQIISGAYGNYGIATQWDAPFAWNNENCEELIYGFTSSYGYSHWVYDANMFWWGAPFKAAPYFGFSDWGDMNHRFGLQPGLDLTGNEYAFVNGKPIRKFKKYPDDVRLKKYRNLGNSTREGMFIFGTLDYVDANGTTKYIRADNGKYQLFMRDQVGWYEDTDTLSISPKPTSGAPTMISDMDHADQSSGWCLIKYPIYRSEDAGKMESDYALIRLSEIYYMLAEVKFRLGDKASAAKLLNAVRARYYPEGSPSLYKPDGMEITEQELLDEWGREFIGESQRRTVLCRFGVYTGEWWDKAKEADNHTMLLPIARTILQANPSLIQNPGYLSE